VQVMYFKNNNQSVEKNESPISGLIPMFIFASLIIFIGVYPNFVMTIINPAATELLDRIGYIRSVLG